jgi:hypothetical protein
MKAIVVELRIPHSKARTHLIMPGPKMGPRPADFDEQVIKQSPTLIRWNQMDNGEKLRYACREFVKGNGDDEERLMRRVMIARRNNLRDHQTLKRARVQTGGGSTGSGSEPPAKAPKVVPVVEAAPASPSPPPQAATGSSRKRRPASLFSDAQVCKEMDVQAVEATRSYRTWLELPQGGEFIYNQKYVKGKDGHDWLLRKNIWRRMRYRRENKKMVERMKETVPPGTSSYDHHHAPPEAAQIVDHALLPTTDSPASPLPGDPQSHAADDNHSPRTEDSSERGPNTRSDKRDYRSSSPHEHDESFHLETAAVEAAVAVAESYAKSPYNMVHNPLEAAANTAALDAAARLAAAASTNAMDDEAVAAAAAAVTDELEDV